MTTTFSTIAGSETDVSDEALEEFRTVVRGNVLTPADEAYDRVRAPYNAMQIDRPALIVQCSGTADVVDTVNFAPRGRWRWRLVPGAAQTDRFVPTNGAPL